MGAEGAERGQEVERTERVVSLVPAQRSLNTKLKSEDLTSGPDALINSPNPSTDQSVEATALTGLQLLKSP